MPALRKARGPAAYECVRRQTQRRCSGCRGALRSSGHFCIVHRKIEGVIGTSCEVAPRRGVKRSPLLLWVEQLRMIDAVIDRTSKQSTKHPVQMIDQTLIEISIGRMIDDCVAP